MASTMRARRQPCSHCGEKVVIIESDASALGGLLHGKPRIAVQHVDFEPGSKRADHVDSACTREVAGE